MEMRKKLSLSRLVLSIKKRLGIIFSEDSFALWRTLFQTYERLGMPQLKNRLPLPRVPFFFGPNRFQRLVIDPGVTLEYLVEVFRASQLSQIFSIVVEEKFLTRHGQGRIPGGSVVRIKTCHSPRDAETFKLERGEQNLPNLGQQFSQLNPVEFLLNIMYMATVKRKVPNYYNTGIILLGPPVEGLVPYVRVNLILNGLPSSSRRHVSVDELARLPLMCSTITFGEIPAHQLGNHTVGLLEGHSRAVVIPCIIAQ